MNSLYGRFGISPEYTQTSVCSPERFREIVKGELRLIYSQALSDQYVLVSYRNTADSEEQWKPSRNAAVQISAAITAYARIFMDKWVNRDDCYYTDSDG